MAFGFALIFFFAAPAHAVVMTFDAAMDATLIENSEGMYSAGGENGVFVGRTYFAQGDTLRRGMIAFDLTAIPANATINAVSLQMTVVHATDDVPKITVELHRVLGRWGEGTVNPDGNGIAGDYAEAGDATWLHKSFPDRFWNNPGGDHNPVSSAAQYVYGSGYVVTWTPTPPLVEDVQDWVNDPTLNYGWMIRGHEWLSGTTREFGSRTAPNPAHRPVLTVDFSVPDTRIPGDINHDGVVNSSDVALLAGAYGTVTTPSNFDVGDFSGDGQVGLADMMILQQHLSPLASASPASVPEPSSLALVGLAVLVAGVLSRRQKR